MAGTEHPTTNEDWRREIARRGQRLEYFTIGWNSVEGLVAQMREDEAAARELLAIA